MAPGDPPTSRERTNEGNADSAVKHSFRLATRTKNISIENQGRIEVLLEIVQKWQGIVDLPAVPDSKDKVESHTVGAICKTVAPPCQSRIRKHQFLGSTTSRSSNKNAVSLIAVLKKASEIPSTTKLISSRMCKCAATKEEKMLKSTALIALLGLLALGGASNPASTAGSWQVDTRHSDAQLKTDATTDYGKKKMDVTLGFGRVRGRVSLDDADPTKSSVDLSLYPANGMMPAIDEDGKFLNDWLANLSNHTLVCFHSKKIVRLPDGKLQATGNLVLTRVDRNVETVASEAYAGPVYGPAMIHRVSRDATFILDIPADGKGQKDGSILASGSTSMVREDFPQLVKAVVTTYWPPLVQDKNCEVPAASEDYHGAQCTGTLLEAPPLPQAPSSTNAEDYPGPSNFNSMVGNHLSILVHLRLTPRSSAGAGAGAN